jgi:hypothetical protein
MSAPEQPRGEPPPILGPPSTYQTVLFGAPPTSGDPTRPAEWPRLPRAVARRLRSLVRRPRAWAASAAGAAAEAWAGVDVYMRRRLAVLGLVAVVIAVVLTVAVPALPCQFPDGSACPPPDDAAKLAPGNALVYVHADLDRSTSQYRLASSIVARIPTLSLQLIGPLANAIPGVGGVVGFARKIRPWVGNEAALVLLPARGPPQQVDLLAIDDDRGARQFRASIVGARARSRTYRGVDVERGRRGVATAIVNGFLAIGTRSGVRQVIDVATGAKGSTSLADTSAAKAVRDRLPANRVADAYLSPAGAAAVAGRATGLLSSLAPFVAPGATEGAAVALVAGSGTMELEIRSALAPQRARTRPGFFAAFAPFDETLASRLPVRTLAYVGFGQPGKALASLLSQARTEEPGLARSFTRLLRQARKAARLHVRRDLPPALGDEAAVALEPAPGPASDIGQATPYVLYAGAGIDAGRARAALARLRRPVARALVAGRGGHRPKIVAGKLAGVHTASLRVSPLVHLTYAVTKQLLAIATNPAGVAALLHPPAGGLAATDEFDRATSGLGDGSLLAYLNLRGLIALGERAGLAANAGYLTLAPEIHRLDGLGISVRSGPDELDTSARLVVGG